MIKQRRNSWEIKERRTKQKAANRNKRNRIKKRIKKLTRLPAGKQGD